MKIEWTDPAAADMESIRDYIARDSEYYAIRFVEKVLELIESITEFPMMGRPVPEVNEENIRELLFHNYRIVYRVEEGRILVVAIVHGSRDLTRKKLQPWNRI